MWICTHKFLFYVEYDLQLAGKDQEILYLKQENESTKRRYEEIYGTKLEDLAEVRVYSGLIVPEIQRMRRSVPTNLNDSLNLGQSKSSLTIIIPQSEREQEPGPEPGEDVQHQLQQRGGEREGAQEEQEPSGQWAQTAGIPDIGIHTIK